MSDRLNGTMLPAPFQEMVSAEAPISEMSFYEIMRDLLTRCQGVAGACRSAASNTETHDDIRAWQDVCQTLDVPNDYLDATVVFLSHWHTTASPGGHGR